MLEQLAESGGAGGRVFTPMLLYHWWTAILVTYQHWHTRKQKKPSLISMVMDNKVRSYLRSECCFSFVTVLTKNCVHEYKRKSQFCYLMLIVYMLTLTA